MTKNKHTMGLVTPPLTVSDKRLSSEQAHQHKKPSQNYLVLMGVLGGVAIAVYFLLFNKVSLHDLRNASEDSLRQTVLGDKPYISFCERQGKVDKKGSAAVVNDVVPKVLSDFMTTKTHGDYTFARLNCSQVLPSGKTIWDRFRLKREWRPTVFITAPWMRPTQAAPGDLRDVESFSKFVESKLIPIATEVKSDAELKKQCKFRDYDATTAEDDESSIGKTQPCIVVLKGSSFYSSKSHAKTVQKLMKAYPKNKFVSVDATKRRLSLEEPKAMKSFNFASKLFALRNASHYLAMEDSESTQADEFVEFANGMPLLDYDHDKLKVVSLVKPPKPAKEAKPPKASATRDSTSSSSSSSSSSEEASASESAEADSTAAADKAPVLSDEERIELERQRREEMERQAAEHYVQSSEDGEDTVVEEAPTEEEEEEEVIDL